MSRLSADEQVRSESTRSSFVLVRVKTFCPFLSSPSLCCHALVLNCSLLPCRRACRTGATTAATSTSTWWRSCAKSGESARLSGSQFRSVGLAITMHSHSSVFFFHGLFARLLECLTGAFASCSALAAYRLDEGKWGVNVQPYSGELHPGVAARFWSMLCSQPTFARMLTFASDSAATCTQPARIPTLAVPFIAYS